MTEIKPTLHPFGKLLTHYLWQTHASQSDFAAATGIPESVISHMKYGRRLSGDNARERVLKTIEYFHQQGTLTTRAEANEFLAKAGMLPLSPEPFDKWCVVLEPKLFDQLLKPQAADGREEIQPGTTQKEHKRRFALPVIPKKVWWVVTAVILLSLLIFIGYRYYLPRGWTLRVNRTDDVNVVLVNNQIVAVDGQRFDGPAKVISLNRFLADQETNIITLVNINGKSRGWWDFELRFDDMVVWRGEGITDKPYQMGYAQNLRVTQDGQVVEIPPPQPANPLTTPITITLDVQEFALVLVNGFAAGAASDSPSGEFIPVEITPFLEPGLSNTLEFKFWATPDEPYWWQIEIWQGSLLWRCSAGGVWASDVDVTEHFTIDAEGKFIYENLEGSCRQ